MSYVQITKKHTYNKIETSVIAFVIRRYLKYYKKKLKQNLLIKKLINNWNFKLENIEYLVLFLHENCFKYCKIFLRLNFHSIKMKNYF